MLAQSPMGLYLTSKYYFCTEMKLSLKTGFVIGAILLAAFSRLIPHPMNFTPIGAMALFGAAYFNRRILAFIIPMLSLYLSNLVIDNTIYAKETFVWMAPSFPWVAGSFILIGLLGTQTLRRINVQNVLLSSFLASGIFFLVSNFGMWTGSELYSKDFSGLVLCFEAAVPFFWNTMVGDFVYSTVLFGGFYLAQQSFPKLATA